MQGGAECATIAISVILSELSETIGPEKPRTAFLRAIHNANEQIYQRFHGNGGTTLSAVLLRRSECVGMNIGDSRIYSVGSSGRLVQLSVDDNIAKEVGRVAAISPTRIKQLEFGEQLTQYLGVGPELQPQIIDPPLGPGETFILASDGAWRSSNGAFSKIVTHAPNPVEIAKRVLNVSNWCGGIDNTTAVIIPSMSLSLQNKSVSDIESNSPQMDIWSPFGRLSVAGEKRLSVGGYRRQPRVEDIPPSAPEDYRYARTRRRKAASEPSRQRQGKLRGNPARGTVEKDPKQLDIQIVVHDDGGTSKNPKSVRGGETRRDGDYAVKKVKSSR